jgi:hypothetical protein
LKEGLVWRVRDGTQINIWNDPWIPSGTIRRPITPRGRTLLNKVSELIDPYSGSWDEELVRGIFWEEDVIHILVIPVKQGHGDSIAWHYDPRVLFSVKSAYHVLVDSREQKKERQKGESSSAERGTESKFWSLLWKVDCVPKIKRFLWRFAHNSLPLRLNIARRGMDADTRCPMCWHLDEDGGHSFLKCKQVRKCWRQLNLEEVRVNLLPLASAREVVQAILCLNRDKQKLVISLLWAWWMGRNKANAGERGPSVEEIASKVVVFSSEIFKQQKGDDGGNNARNRNQMGWKPPPPDVLKINSDGAFRDKDKTGALGVCGAR